eukprot:5239529-Pyramimonas_sp.AAC.2
MWRCHGTDVVMTWLCRGGADLGERGGGELRVPPKVLRHQDVARTHVRHLPYQPRVHAGAPRRSLKVVEDVSGDRGASHDQFMAHLPEDEPRYAVYDYEYTNQDQCKFNKLVFVLWCEYIRDGPGHELHLEQFIPSSNYSVDFGAYYSVLTSLPPAPVLGLVRLSRYTLAFSHLFGFAGSGARRAPDTSSIKNKMIYASTKGELPI